MTKKCLDNLDKFYKEGTIEWVRINDRSLSRKLDYWFNRVNEIYPSVINGISSIESYREALKNYYFVFKAIIKLRGPV